MGFIIHLWKHPLLHKSAMLHTAYSRFLLIGILVLTACVTNEEDPGPPYFLPAEWEPHEAVWFSYYGLPSDTVLDKVIFALDPGSRVVFVVDGDSSARALHSRWDSLGFGERSRFVVMPDSVFSPVVRDRGPIFLQLQEGGLAVLDAGWNYYGDLENEMGMPLHVLAHHDSLPARFARQLDLPLVKTSMVVEGGALEVNGAGTLLQVEAVTLQRNPGWSRDSLEHELERLLGVRSVIWLKEGVADDMWYLRPRVHGRVFGNGTGGHVDEFCRFVNDNTVLLAWPDDDELHDSVHLMTRLRMEENLRILEASRTARGSRIKVVKVPVPVTELRAHALDSLRSYDRWMISQFDDLSAGDTVQYIPAASYLNYVVTNGRVIIPAYWEEGKPEVMRRKDQRFQEVMREWFPDRQIVAVDPRAINRFGGGMHCWTQQQPLVGAAGVVQ